MILKWRPWKSAPEGPESPKPRWKCTALLLILVCLSLPQICTAAEDNWSIIKRHGDQLFEGNRLFRFLGLDAPNLLQNETQVLPDESNRFPNEFEIRDTFDGLRRIGARASRTFVLTVASTADHGQPVYITRRRTYNEAAFRCLDQVLALAHEYDIRLIIPLLASQSFRTVRGVDEFSALADRPPGSFYTDEQVKADYRDLVHYVVNRRNSITGVLYKDDPAILAWQFGNEFSSYAPDRKLSVAEWTPRITQWTLEMAAYIKSEDPNHLVMDAGGADRAALLADPNVDIISDHLYEYWNRLSGLPTGLAALAATSRRECKGRKALVVDEFGLASFDNIQSLVNEIIEDGISGGLMWSVRSHRRDGGWYYHNEGGTNVNSFHVPGFAVGFAFNETKLLDFMRCQAFRMRGQNLPPSLPPSSAPILMARTDGFTWRGATGAATYTIERAENPDGPWAVLAVGLQDSVIADVASFEGTPAASQPLTLYSDESRVPGRKYYYRIKGVNAAGESAYSNVLGTP